MRKKMLYFLLVFIGILTLVSILLGMLEKKIRKNEFSIFSFTQNVQNALTQNPESQNVNTPIVEVFAYSKIPSSILENMIGNSIPDKSVVDTTELSYLTITYWGFDEKTHIGEMIVHKDLAQEVLDIFEEVYDQKYPIEKMKLIDEYNANDETSMAANNTSAFCYRTVANTNKLSKHSLGKAIDVNPLYNPYVVDTSIMPVNSESYIDRSIVQKGMIQKGDALYTAFTKRGWTWGGNWITQKDYQHFEKK